MSFEATDPTVDSQVIQIQSSGVDVFFNACAPKAAAQAIRKVADLGWKPAHYLQRLGLGRLDSEACRAPENSKKGIITAYYLKDFRPTRGGRPHPTSSSGRPS